MTSTPFSFRATDDAIDDLRLRLRHTRWAAPIGAPGWEAGTDATELRRLVDYWATAYDWREHESAINALPAFTSDIARIRVLTRSPHFSQ